MLNTFGLFVHIYATTSTTDESCADAFQARMSYTPDEIVCNARFMPCVSVDENHGKIFVDFSSLHDIMPL